MTVLKVQENCRRNCFKVIVDIRNLENIFMIYYQLSLLALSINYSINKYMTLFQIFAGNCKKNFCHVNMVRLKIAEVLRNVRFASLRSLPLEEYIPINHLKKVLFNNLVMNGCANR